MPEHFFKDPDWLRQFLHRIKILMEREGIDDQQEFNEKIGTQRALTRWKARETSPSLKSLLAIRKVFGVSLDWLVLGEETPGELTESRPDYEAQPLGEVEEKLLQQVNDKLEEVIQQEKAVLTPAERFSVFTRVYNDCAEDRKPPDAVMVRRYIWAFSKAKR